MFTYVKILTDMSKIYEYIWIHVIDIYDMKNKAKYALSYNISTMFSVNSPWICIDTNSTLLGSSSSPTMTQKETTIRMIYQSTITTDATSGRENLWKNFI